MGDYLKIPELARRLDVSEPTARRMVKGGKLPSVFIGGAYRVSTEDLERFLEAAKVTPGKASAPSAEAAERRAELGEWKDVISEIASKARVDLAESRRRVESGDATPASLGHLGVLYTGSYEDQRKFVVDAYGIPPRDADASVREAADQVIDALNELGDVVHEIRRAYADSGAVTHLGQYLQRRQAV